MFRINSAVAGTGEWFEGRAKERELRDSSLGGRSIGWVVQSVLGELEFATVEAGLCRSKILVLKLFWKRTVGSDRAGGDRKIFSLTSAEEIRRSSEKTWGINGVGARGTWKGMLLGSGGIVIGCLRAIGGDGG